MATERITMKFNKGMMLDYVPVEIDDGYAQNISGAVISDEGIKSVALSAASAITGITTQIIRGIIEVRAADGNLYWIFGTSDGKLWRCPATLGSTTATDISKSGATYSDAEWSFAQYSDWLVATNGIDSPQVLKGIAGAANFEDLGGSPPKGKYVYLDNGHLVFANIGSLVTVNNGTFSATGSWTGFGAVWTLTASQAVKFADGTTALEQNVSAEGGNTYILNFTIDNLPADTTTWTERTYTNTWRVSHRVAMSLSGTHQLTTSNNLTAIYRSSNSGVAWGTVAKVASDVDMSNDGATQYLYGSVLWKSLDSGSSYATATASGIVSIGRTAIACSADGTLVVTVGQSGYVNQVHKSTDSGGSFTTILSQTLSTTPSGIEISRTNGSVMVVIPDAVGQLYISTNTGSTWNARGDVREWQSVALSADGTKIYACVDGGYIYKSEDYGVTWIQKGSSRYYRRIACSSDGTKVTAIVNNGYIYVSIDSGDTWIEQGTSKGWAVLGMSGSGNKQTAGWSPNGTLYTYDTIENTMVVEIGGTSSGTITLEEKQYSLNLASESTGNLKFTPSNTSRFTLDNVSVQTTGDGAKTVQWSAYENVEDYVTSLSTGADSQVLYEGDGNIVGMCRLGNRYAVLFDRSIVVGQYIGGDYTFSFQKPLTGFTVASGGSGFTSSGNRWASIGDSMFFCGVDDFYWTDGQSIKSVTKGNRQHFFTTNRSQQVHVYPDMKNNLVLFSKYDLGIGDPDGGVGHTHRILAYNYVTEGWSHYAFVTDASYLLGSFPRLVTVESNELVNRLLVAYLYKNASGTVNMRYWDDSSFSEVIVKTKEIGNGMDVMTLTRIKPHYHLRESSDYPQVTASFRMDEADAQTWTTEGSIGRNGFYDVICTGVFLGAKLTWKGPSTFNAEANISGCTLFVNKTGER